MRLHLLHHSRIAVATLLLAPALVVAQTDPPTATLEVYKYEDRNSNQQIDAGEMGLNGWSITVSDNTDPNNPVEVATLETADRTLDDGTMEPGWAIFEDLPLGEYLVCETLPVDEEWLNTDPGDDSLCKALELTETLTGTPGPDSATIVTGASSYEVEFVEQVDETWTYRVTELSGTDLSHWNLIDLGVCLDRIVEVNPSAEIGYDGSTSTIGVKWNTAGLAGSGEFSVTFDAIYPATTIQALAKGGDGDASEDINGPDCSGGVANGNPVVQLGNTRPLETLTVRKYHDLNQDGLWDADEPGLNGWEIVVFDLEGNVVLSDSTSTSLDGEDGVVSFNLPPGDYEVCETLQAGWVNTDPGVQPVCQTLTLDGSGGAIDAPGPELATLVFPVTESTIDIQLVSREGATWTYRVSEIIGQDLSHWNLGIGSCLDNIVSSTPDGAELGLDGSSDDFDGIKWDVSEDFSSEDFSFTLDADYPSATVEALVKISNDYVTAELIGPNCDEAPRGDEIQLAFGNWFDETTAVAGSAHAVVLLDRTGSMQALRASGVTRCSDALTMARLDVESFFVRHPEATGSSLAVWVFGNDVVNLSGGFVDQASALAVLDELDPEGCTGTTPLADALCEASDALVQTFPNAQREELFMAVSSDGGENDSSGACAGPDSEAETPPYSDGSWQNNVFAKLTAQNIIDIRFWDDFASVTRSTPVTREGKRSRVANKAVSDTSFFRTLAGATGGSFTLVNDNVARLPVPFFQVQTPVAIPTLSLGSMVLLLSMLGISALVAMRRQRR